MTPRVDRPPVTHYLGCWQEHPECAHGKIRDAVDVIRGLMVVDAYTRMLHYERRANGGFCGCPVCAAEEWIAWLE